LYQLAVVRRSFAGVATYEVDWIVGHSIDNFWIVVTQNICHVAALYVKILGIIGIGYPGALGAGYDFFLFARAEYF
jgi:hypothetical protein